MGYIVQQAAQGACDHQGAATVTSVAANVKINGSPIVVVPASYSVAGCPFSTNAGPMPCVTLMFQSGGARNVKVNGMPVLLGDATPTAIGPLPSQGSGSLKGVQTAVKAT